MVDSPKETKKKQMLIFLCGAGGFLALLMFGMWVSDPNKGKPSALEVAQEKASVINSNYTDKADKVTSEERWVAKSEQRLQEQQFNIKAGNQKNLMMEKKIEELARQIKQLKGDNTGIDGEELVSDNDDISSRKLPPVPEKRGQSTPVFPAPPNSTPIANRMLPAVPNGAQKSGVAPPEQKTGIFEISLDDSEVTTSGEKKDIVKNAENYIPAGSFVTAVMLAGVDAPTGGLAQTDPAPVLFRIKEDARLPNFFKSEIKECLVIGAGVGNLSSERVLVRLEKMSCVLANGDVFDKTVKGWVTGEDGKAGLRGKVISKQGRLIAMAALSGIASGLGTSVNDQYTATSTSALGTVSTIDANKVGQAGLAQGFSTSMEKVSDYYMERADETYPIIEASAKRVVELVFNEGVDFGDLAINGNTRTR